MLRCIIRGSVDIRTRMRHLSYCKGRIWLFASVVLLFCTASHAWEEPNDFRGIKWGTSSGDAENFIRGQWKQRREAGEIIIDTDISKFVSDERLQSRLFRDKVGGLLVTINLDFLDDKFVYATISFKSEDFRIIEGAFKERYGPPMSEARTPVETRFGAKYENKELKWNGPTLHIWLRQYYGKITEGIANLGKLAYLKYLMEKDKKKRGEAAKDL
jgi:hypothetical protein